MMTSADMQGPGSGIGPQAGGFSPTPADAMASRLRQQSSQQLMQWALYNDPRTRAMSGMLAKGLAGDDATAANLIKNTSAGQMIKDMSAAVVQSGIMPGGNPAQMAFHTQQMMATQGFRVGGNMGGGGQLFGSGFVTDQLSKSVFSNVSKNFFDQTTGLSKRNAFGMDMSQMGDAMGYLTSRGAFKGQKIGDLNHFNSNAEIAKARAAAKAEGGNEDYLKELDALEKGGKGGFAFKIDKSKMKKVNDMFSNFAGTLRDAREIFGNLPVGELAQAAERLIGTSITENGAMGTMRTRMASIRAVANANGLNPEAVARNMMDVGSAVAQGMHQTSMQDPRMSNPFQSAAASTSFGRYGAAVGSAAVMAGIHGESASTQFANSANGYVRQFDQQQIQGSVAAGVGHLLTDKSTNMTYSLAARSLIEQGAISGPDAGKIKELMAQLGKEGNTGKARDINNQIASLIGASGIDLGSYLRNNTTADMLGSLSLESTAQHTQMLQDNYRAASINSLNKYSTQKTDSGMLGSDANKKGFFKLMSGLDSSSLRAIEGALNPDGSVNQEKLAKAYADNPGMADVISQGDLTKTISGLASSPGRKSGDFTKQFSSLTKQFKGDAMNMDVVTDMDSINSRKREAQEYLGSISMGGALTPEDFSTQLVRGFFGAGKVDDQTVMQYLKNTKSKDIMSLKMNKDKTGFDLKGADIAKLSSTLGEEGLNKLYDKLGVKQGDSDALAKAISSSGFKGIEAIKEAVGGAGAVVSAEGDNFNIVGQKAVDEATKTLEFDAQLEQARRLTGKADFGSGAENTVEGRAKLKNETNEDFKNNPRRMLELAQNAEKMAFSGKDYETLQAQMKNDPALSQILKKQEDQLRADGLAGKGDWKLFGPNEDKIKEANSLGKVRQRLEGESGGNKFLGILEIATDSITQLRLMQTQ